MTVFPLMASVGAGHRLVSPQFEKSSVGLFSLIKGHFLPHTDEMAFFGKGLYRVYLVSMLSSSLFLIAEFWTVVFLSVCVKDY